MLLLIVVAIVAVVALLSARGLWDRFKGDGDYGIEPWMLRTPGLGGLDLDDAQVAWERAIGHVRGAAKG